MPKQQQKSHHREFCIRKWRHVKQITVYMNLVIISGVLSSQHYKTACSLKTAICCLFSIWFIFNSIILVCKFFSLKMILKDLETNAIVFLGIFVGKFTFKIQGACFARLCVWRSVFYFLGHAFVAYSGFSCFSPSNTADHLLHLPVFLLLDFTAHPPGLRCWCMYKHT